MGKGPLITRTELRKRKEAAEVEREEEMLREEEYQEREQEISDFYRKERDRNKDTTKTRSGEQTKIRERSSKLTKAIIIVAVLLVIVMLIVLNI